MINQMLDDDLKQWKVFRFIKDESDVSNILLMKSF